MKIKVLTKVAIILVSSSVIAPNIFAKNIRECGKRGPSKTTGELNNFREAKTNAVSGRNLVVFGNNEKKLPKAGKNETYYEFDLGRDGFNGRGSHRAVILVQTGEKNKIVKSYFTQDHYASFCVIK